MGRISRYVLVELIKIFTVTLAGMTGMMILAGVVQEAYRQGLSPADILRLIPFILPNALCFAIPGTILFAACSVYGRMSASNEIVAVKSLGISPVSIVWPALVLAFCLSLVTVWLNDLAVSWGRHGVYRVVLHSVERTVYGLLRSQSSYSNGRISIYVRQVDDDVLINPTVEIQGSGGGPSTFMTAREARLHSNPAEGVLIVSAKDGTIHFGDDAVYDFPEENIRVPLRDMTRRGERSESPSNYPLREIGAELKEQKVKIEQQQQLLAIQSGFHLCNADFDHLSSADWKNQEQQLKMAEVRKHRLRTEPWRRWANGFSCFFFVVVGIPLAVRLKNSDVWTSFALCFIPILLGYYPLLAFGLDRAKAGALPPYVVWLGNVVTLLVGIYLFRRMTRY